MLNLGKYESLDTRFGSYKQLHFSFQTQLLRKKLSFKNCYLLEKKDVTSLLSLSCLNFQIFSLISYLAVP